MPLLQLCAVLICSAVPEAANVALRAADSTNGANEASTPAPHTWERWRRRHQQLRAEAARREATVLFLGDSITENWSEDGSRAWTKHFQPINSVNFGISADRTQTLLWRIEHGGYERMRPKVIVLLIGANNIKEQRNTARETSDGILACVQALRRRLPDSRLLVLGVLPCGETTESQERRDAAQINRNVEAFLDKSVDFLDPSASLLAGDGALLKEVSPDYLHLSAEGYQRLAKAISPHIARLVSNEFTD